MTTTLTPNLMTDSVNDSIAFYRDRLGFRFIVGVPFDSEEMVCDDPDRASLQWAMVERDGARIMFQARASLAHDFAPLGGVPIGASATLYLELEGLDALLALAGDGVEVAVPERVTFYGMREVWIKDNNGYLLTLAEKAAQP